MSKGFIHKFFPMPKYLRMPSLGMDISDKTIKYAELLPEGDGLVLGRFGQEKLPDNVINNGKINDPEKLKAALLKIKKSINPDFVKVSLPEQQGYLFNLSVEDVDKDGIRNSIEVQFEDHVPISLAESIFDYQIIAEKENGFDLQVAVFPLTVIETYKSLFVDIGLYVSALETEDQAIARSVIPDGYNKACIIVDFGATRTGVSVISSGVALFSSTIDIGGQALTSSVAKDLDISFQEAEELKKKYGLKKNKKENEVFSALMNNVSIIRDEINKHYTYWHNHRGRYNREDEEVEKIIVCGGDANLPGFVEYLATSMKVDVEKANVWTNVNSFDEYIPEIDSDKSLSFPVAIGLALSDFKEK